MSEPALILRRANEAKAAFRAEYAAWKKGTG
jgi:hypothetical protein